MTMTIMMMIKTTTINYNDSGHDNHNDSDHDNNAEHSTKVIAAVDSSRSNNFPKRPPINNIRLALDIKLTKPPTVEHMFDFGCFCSCCSVFMLVRCIVCVHIVSFLSIVYFCLLLLLLFLFCYC